MKTTPKAILSFVCLFAGFYYFIISFGSLFVSKGNEPLSYYILLFGGPFSIIPLVTIGSFLPRMGGILLISATFVSSVANYYFQGGFTPSFFNFELRCSAIMFLMGFSFLIVGIYSQKINPK
jgi:hypothetical protein